jgi:hypothetical protein
VSGSAQGLDRLGILGVGGADRGVAVFFAGVIYPFFAGVIYPFFNGIFMGELFLDLDFDGVYPSSPLKSAITERRDLLFDICNSGTSSFILQRLFSL